MELDIIEDAPILDIAIQVPAEENPAIVYLSRMPSSSRRVVLSRLRHVTDVLNRLHGSPGWLDAYMVPWGRLKYSHVAAIRSRLQEEDPPLAFTTINGILAAVKGVCRESFRLGQMSSDELARIRELEPVRGERLLSGRALSAQELYVLMLACARDTTVAGRRDAALIGTLYVSGVRRDEASHLNLEDYDQVTGSLTVLSGKGNRSRICYVGNNGAGEVLLAWLAVRGSAPGPLFCQIRKGGHIQLAKLSGQAIYTILNKRATESGVPAFRPHDLRRTHISDLLSAGADLATVSALVGHASVSVTARYDRRGEATKARAASLLHLPYVAKEKHLDAGQWTYTKLEV